MIDPNINLKIITVNYNLPNDTIECIQSLFKSDFSPIDIIVVDNGSEDNSVNILSRAFQSIQIIKLSTNTGFVGGYNTGIEHALQTGATHVLILNNDTVIERNAISTLLLSNWDIAIPKILFFSHPHLVQSAGARWRAFPPSVVLRGFRHKDSRLYDRPAQLQFASGCAMLIKRAVFERVGKFDVDYQNYSEDYDFCYRVTSAGFTIGYVPRARIYHKDSLTAGKAPKCRRWFLGRNTVLFYRKNNRFPSWYLWSFMTWLSMREFIKGNLTHLPDYWRGFRDGFRFIAR